MSTLLDSGRGHFEVLLRESHTNSSKINVKCYLTSTKRNQRREQQIPHSSWGGFLPSPLSSECRRGVFWAVNNVNWHTAALQTEKLLLIAKIQYGISPICCSLYLWWLSQTQRIDKTKESDVVSFYPSFLLLFDLPCNDYSIALVWAILYSLYHTNQPKNFFKKFQNCWNERRFFYPIKESPSYPMHPPPEGF